MLAIYKKNLSGRGLRGNSLLVVITLMSGLGFMTVGYDNGLMGGFINGDPWNNTFDHPNSTLVGTIVSLYEVGGFLGGVLSSFVGEKFGRRQSIGFGAIFLIIGAIIQTASYSRGQLMVGRVVSGIGVGIQQSSIPSLQSEVTPKGSRGFYAAAYLTMLNFGILLSYWINYGLGFVNNDVAWRFPTAFQLVFVFAVLFLTFIIPESPRWLMLHDQSEEAAEVISALLDKPNTDPSVAELLDQIKAAVLLELSEGSGEWIDFIKEDELQTRRRLWTACLVQIFQQATGVNMILYYTTSIFHKSIGFSERMASLMSGILNIWLFVFSFVPWYLIDRMGRRPLFLIGTSGQLIAFVISAGMVYKVDTDNNSEAYGIVAAAMLFIFLGSFTFGMQATVWLYPTEVVPLRLRSKGASISTASNWIINFGVTMITPIAFQNIGYKTYIIFSCFNFVFLFIVYFYFKETRGLSLEGVDSLYAKTRTSESPELSELDSENNNHQKASDLDDYSFEKPTTSMR